MQFVILFIEDFFAVLASAIYRIFVGNGLCQLQFSASCLSAVILTVLSQFVECDAF